MGYVRSLRVLYVALLDQYATPGAITSTKPSRWAQSSVQAEVLLHISIVAMAAIHLFGPPPALPKFYLYAGALAFAALLTFSLHALVFNETKIAAVREELKARPRADVLMQRFGIAAVRTVSTILFLVLLYSYD